MGLVEDLEHLYNKRRFEEKRKQFGNFRLPPRSGTLIGDQSTVSSVVSSVKSETASSTQNEPDDTIASSSSASSESSSSLLSFPAPPVESIGSVNLSAPLLAGFRAEEIEERDDEECAEGDEDYDASAQPEFVSPTRPLLGEMLALACVTGKAFSHTRAGKLRTTCLKSLVVLQGIVGMYAYMTFWTGLDSLMQAHLDVKWLESSPPLWVELLYGFLGLVGMLGSFTFCDSAGIYFHLPGMQQRDPIERVFFPTEMLDHERLQDALRFEVARLDHHAVNETYLPPHCKPVQQATPASGASSGSAALGGAVSSRPSGLGALSINGGPGDLPFVLQSSPLNSASPRISRTRNSF